MKKFLFLSIFFTLNAENLVELGRKHKTDKVDHYHSFHGQSFMHVYEKYMAPMKSTTRNIVEIGILKGASLKVWKDYFPNATVHGIDIDPTTKVHEDLENGIHVHIGDQSSPDFLQKVISEIDGPIDIVLDDGSHVNDFTIASFRELFPHVSQGGIYIMEDLHTTYMKLDSVGKVRNIWPGMQHNDKNVSIDNDRNDFLYFIANLTHSIDCHEKGLLPGILAADLTAGVHAVHYHHYTMVIEKCKKRG